LRHLVDEALDVLTVEHGDFFFLRTPLVGFGGLCNVGFFFLEMALGLSA
jgi:hypothetical protein